MDKQTLYYNKNCTITFVAFVQANNDNNPKKSDFLQKIDGIYLILFDKIQGRHEIFDLRNHIVITRRNNIEIPIYKEIIKHIDEMAAREKVAFAKIQKIFGVIYNNDLIAGVEYEGTEDENENYSEEYQEYKDYTEN